MTQKSNQLLNKSFDIDFTVFSQLKLTDIECWEQLEMQAAVCGIDIGQHLIEFLICISFYKESIMKILKDGITKHHVLDLFSDHMTAVETIYRMLDPKTLNSNQFNEAVRKYIDVANECDIDVYHYDEDFDKDNVNRWKISLLHSVDVADPLILIRFYDKWKLTLHCFDMPFVRFMHRVLKEKAHRDKCFIPLLDAVEKEISKQQNTVMFLN